MKDPWIKGHIQETEGFSGGIEGKEFACSVGDSDSIHGSGRSPREGNGNLLQYPCQENSMDRGAWQATVHGAAKSWTRLSDFTHSTGKLGNHPHTNISKPATVKRIQMQDIGNVFKIKIETT